MVWVLLIVGIGLVWFLVSSSGKKQEFQREMAFPLVVESTDDRSCRSWELNFPAMEATLCQEFREYGYEDWKQQFHIRRHGSQWEAQLTRASFDDALKDLKESLAKPVDSDDFGRRERERKDLAEMEEGPQWGPFPDVVASKIEGHYQRFLVHSKVA